MGTAEDLQNKEDAKKKRQRHLTWYIVYFTFFALYFTSSCTILITWPYLNQLDPSVKKVFMGFIYAAFPLGETIFAPLVGFWSNKLGSIKTPAIVCLLVNVFSNLIYSNLELFSHPKYVMLISSFLSGSTLGGLTLCHSFISISSTMEERTKAVSLLTMFKFLSWSVAPGVQVVTAFLGKEGFWLIPHYVRVTMFTAPSMISAIISLIACSLYYLKVFENFEKQVETKKRVRKPQDLNYFKIITIIVLYCVTNFTLVSGSILWTPLVMEQFSWTNQAAVEYVGTLDTVMHLVSLLIFPLIPRLSKAFKEINLLIWCALCFILLGRIMYLPLGSKYPEVYDFELKVNLSQICKTRSFNETALKNSTRNCGDDLLGCPSTQKWCYYTPAISIYQFVIGFVANSVGFPFATALIYSIYAKTLGDIPQGVWMGIMISISSVSRLFCPVVTMYIYSTFGTIGMLLLTSIAMGACLVWVVYFKKRLIEETVLQVQDSESAELQN